MINGTLFQLILIEVLSASRNLFFSDSYDVIAVLKLYATPRGQEIILTFGIPLYYLQYFANLRRGIIRHREQKE